MGVVGNRSFDKTSGLRAARGILNASIDIDVRIDIDADIDLQVP